VENTVFNLYGRKYKGHQIQVKLVIGFFEGVKHDYEKKSIAKTKQNGVHDMCENSY
jgi:hypothetical protein